MREMIKMVVVLTVLCAFSGGLLAAIRNGTMDQIENQQLKFVKGPAIKDIFKGASNDPILDRFKLMDGEVGRSFFIGKFEGQAMAVALESFGKGYGGDVGVMVGINMDENKILGVGVTTHAETPGMGARAKEDPSFAAQYVGLPIDEPIKVSDDGGQINAISGATITSRAVSAATTEACEIYARLKPQITEKIKSMHGE